MYWKMHLPFGLAYTEATSGEKAQFKCWGSFIGDDPRDVCGYEGLTWTKVSQEEYLRAASIVKREVKEAKKGDYDTESRKRGKSFVLDESSPYYEKLSESSGESPFTTITIRNQTDYNKVRDALIGIVKGVDEKEERDRVFHSIIDKLDK